jgi:hypothetical protein
LAAPFQAVAERFGGLSEPTLDRPLGQSLAIDAGGFARLNLAQRRDILGKVLLAAARKGALSFLGCEFADADGHTALPFSIIVPVVARANSDIAGSLCAGAWRSSWSSA